MKSTSSQCWVCVAIEKFNKSSLKCCYGDKGTYCTVVKVQKNITVQHVYKTEVNMLMFCIQYQR